MGLCMTGKIALNRVLGPRTSGSSFLIETAFLQAIA
jgi:hypothetical protein